MGFIYKKSFLKSGLRLACSAFAILAFGKSIALAATPETSFSYTSQVGDWIGQGKTGAYSATTTPFTIFGDRTSVRVLINWGSGGNFSDIWQVELAAPRGEQLRPGVFGNAERASFRTGRSPGLDVSGPGRGCNEVWGSFTVSQIEFDATGKVSMLDANLVQRCSMTGAAISARLKINALPLSLTLRSDVADWVGQGVSKVYENHSSTFSLRQDPAWLSYSASGNRDSWSARIAPPTGTSFVAGRTYAIARFAGVGFAGFDFSGNGRGCNQTSGTLTVHAITRDTAGVIKGLHASFVQKCDNSLGALTGTIRYLE